MYGTMAGVKKNSISRKTDQGVSYPLFTVSSTVE
jgi:hypothetical protein